VVKPGDTLASIATKQYGTASLWTSIYAANKHLIDDPTKIEAGQKIVLP
jgi:nucleoid-associated protein YgaU